MEDGFHKAGRNKIIIQKRLGNTEIEQIKKHKNCTEIGLWYIKNKDLNFLELLPKLTAVDFYGIHTEDFEMLTKIENLKSVFLNGIKNHEDLSFINRLTQIEELDLLYLPKLEKFPDLSDCKKLARVRISQCKKLADLENLTLIPNLEEFSILGTPHKPNELEFLIKLPKIKYFSGQFGSTKLNKQFEDLLINYGKTQYKPK